MIKVLHVYKTFFPDTQGGLEEVIRQIDINYRGTVFGTRSLGSSLYGCCIGK